MSAERVAISPSAPGPSWLVVEPHFDGHHYTYLEHIVEGLLARGVRVLVGIGDDEAQGARTRAALQSRFGSRVTIVAAALPRAARGLPGIGQLVVNELRRRRFLARIFRAARARSEIDHVLLPYLDWSLFAIAVAGSPFGSTPFSGITMRQRFHLRSRRVVAAPEPLQRMKGRLFRRLLRAPSLRRVLTNDETLAEYFAEDSSPGAQKVVHIPDPSTPRAAPSRAAARLRLGIGPECCVVLLYGYIDARKGVRSFLSWLARPDTPDHVVALVVGQRDREVEPLFADPAVQSLVDAGRLRSVNAFVPEEDEPLYFAAADLVWLGYDRFEMMSGVLVKAAQYERAVLFHHYGLIAHYALKHGTAYVPAGTCASVLETLPPGVLVRDFGGAQGAVTLPDHSWANAIHLIHD